MIYRIDHRVEYEYSQPVYLEPHQLHLMPRDEAFQKVHQFHLKISPEPVTLTRIIDIFGNPAHEVWFRGTASRLMVEASSVVEVSRTDPFNYLLRESAMRLPMRYPQTLLPGLRPYLQHSEEENAKVRAFSDLAAERAGYDAVGFLSELCLLIHSRIRNTRREDGLPWSAERTITEGKGACRDLTVLFMACCLAQGLAARFTSGYAEKTVNDASNDLHAWAEVYLEGAGWRGYDPATGLAVCEQYVPLASSPDPQLVTPVVGAFRGPKGAFSKFQAQVSIRSVSGGLYQNSDSVPPLPAVNL